MAPIELDSVDCELRDIIQTLYEVQSAVHGYLGVETQHELVRQLETLTSSSSTLQDRTAPSNPRKYQLPLVPPEVVSYVDSGRNPDIYNREFVELVQKGNSTVGAKSEAFGSFRDILAEEMANAMPELNGEIEKVLRNTAKSGAGQRRS